MNTEHLSMTTKASTLAERVHERVAMKPSTYPIAGNLKVVEALIDIEPVGHWRRTRLDDLPQSRSDPFSTPQVSGSA